MLDLMDLKLAISNVKERFSSTSRDALATMNEGAMT
jgi:hypothetical protein